MEFNVEKVKQNKKNLLKILEELNPTYYKDTQSLLEEDSTNVESIYKLITLELLDNSIKKPSEKYKILLLALVELNQAIHCGLQVDN